MSLKSHVQWQENRQSFRVWPNTTEDIKQLYAILKREQDEDFKKEFADLNDDDITVLFLLLKQQLYWKTKVPKE